MVFAHPDDETLAAGALLAKMAVIGVETHLVVATAGEAGWKASPRPEPAEVARHRESELRAAAHVLGVRSVRVLGFPDGNLERAPEDKVVGMIAERIRDVRPDAVLTFGPDGITGHPDHAAVSRFTTAAVTAAAVTPASTMAEAMFPPPAVGALWYVGMTATQHRSYEALIGPLEWRRVDPPLRPGPWEPWTVTGTVDTRAYAGAVRKAVLCHGSQLRDSETLRAAPTSAWQAAFGRTALRRALTPGEGYDPIARELLTDSPFLEFYLPAAGAVTGVGLA
ncbi:MAG: PIG-L family deacetylase [Trueperaceae bacterium]